MARYLLDTDWVIYCLRGRRPVAKRVNELRPLGLAVSVLTIAELYQGVHASRDPDRAAEAMWGFMTEIEVFPVTTAVSDRFGEHAAMLSRQNKQIGDFDLVIAATCLVYDLTLLSNNRNHFDRVAGLRIESIDL